MADQVDQLVGCVGFAVGVEDEDGAADFGGRVEGAGVEGHEDAGLGVELDVEGEEAVGVVAGFGDDAVGDFLLQHEDGALAVRVGDDAAQDGGADVVGEVADGAVGAGGEGGLDGVFQAEVDAVAEACPEAGVELGVDLDGGQGVREVDELLGQDAFAGADLENHVVGLGLDGGDDAVDGAAVAEEVLAPLLLRPH